MDISSAIDFLEEYGAGIAATAVVILVFAWVINGINSYESPPPCYRTITTTDTVYVSRYRPKVKQGVLVVQDTTGHESFLPVDTQISATPCIRESPNVR